MRCLENIIIGSNMIYIGNSPQSYQPIKSYKLFVLQFKLIINMRKDMADSIELFNKIMTNKNKFGL